MLDEGGWKAKARPPGRMLHPGTNGTTLTQEEAARAREKAEGLTGIGQYPEERQAKTLCESAAGVYVYMGRKKLCK